MSGIDITIRDCNYDDINDLALLMNQLGYPTTIDEMKNRYGLIAAHPDYKTIIAVINDEIVGVAGLCKGIFYEKNDLYMRILAFVVKQNSRKKGVGKSLLYAAENWAKEQYLKTILINSGNRDERAEAYAFYKAMGYTIKSSGFVKQL